MKNLRKLMFSTLLAAFFLLSFTITEVYGANIEIVFDISGSMAGTRLATAKKGINNYLDPIVGNEEISIVLRIYTGCGESYHYLHEPPHRIFAGMSVPAQDPPTLW